MKYFIFTKFNFIHYLFLSYFIINTVKSIIKKLNSSSEDIISSFFSNYLATFSDFLSIIPVLIIKKRTKSSKANEDNENTSDKFNLIFHDKIKESANKKKPKIFILIIICSFMKFLGEYSDVILLIILKKNLITVNSFNLNSVLIINIISHYIFSKIFLHSIFYRHHYLSFLINIIFLIILVIMDIFQIKDKDNEPIITFLYIVSKIITVIFYSIEDTLAKIILTYNFVSPYIFLLYRGIFLNSLVFIFSFIFIFVNLPDEKGEDSCVFTRFWKLFEKKTNILIFIGIFIINFLYNVNIFLVIDRFSPSHVAMTTIIGHFGNLFISLIYKKIEIYDFFLRLIIYIILIIAASIHNEFMILNFCQLQKNTKLFLEKEAENDITQNINDIGIVENQDDLDINSINSEKINDLKNN